MSNAIIRKAFESRLKTWADAQTPAIKIAYENVSFTPPTGRYLRCFMLPASTDSETLDGTHRNYSGVFQVSIVVPLNQGSAEALVIASAIDALYPVTFVQDSLRITMTRPMGIRPGQVEENMYVLPIDGAYRLDTI